MFNIILRSNVAQNGTTISLGSQFGITVTLYRQSSDGTDFEEVVSKNYFIHFSNGIQETYNVNLYSSDKYYVKYKFTDIDFDSYQGNYDGKTSWEMSLRSDSGNSVNISDSGNSGNTGVNPYFGINNTTQTFKPSFNETITFSLSFSNHS